MTTDASASSFLHCPRAMTGAVDEVVGGGEQGVASSLPFLFFANGAMPL